MVATTADNNQRTNKISAVAISVGFHMAIIFILMLLWIRYDQPVQEDGGGNGILINFGDSQTGTGDIEPQSIEAGKPQPSVAAAPAAKSDDDEVVTQDLEPVVNINKKPVKKNIEKPVVKTEPKKTTTNT